MTRRNPLHEILILAAAAATGAALYEFLIRPVLVKTLAGVPPQQQLR